MVSSLCWYDYYADLRQIQCLAGTGIYALTEPTAAEQSAFFQVMTDQLPQPPQQNFAVLPTVHMVSDICRYDYYAELRQVQCFAGTGIYALSEPTAAERSAFFQGITDQLAQPPRQNLTRKRKATEPPQVRLSDSHLSL